MWENRLQLWLSQGIIFTGTKERGAFCEQARRRSLAAAACSLGSVSPGFHLALGGNELTFSVSFLQTPN